VEELFGLPLDLFFLSSEYLDLDFSFWLYLCFSDLGGSIKSSRVNAPGSAECFILCNFSLLFLEVFCLRKKNQRWRKF
jgi:hypothetical protein